MRIYLTIVLASILIVLIQSTSSAKTKKIKSTTVSSRNGHVTSTTHRPTTIRMPTNPPTTKSRTTSNVGKKCEVMDMILVLCSNEGVNRGRWTNVLHIAKNIIGRFNLSPDAVRVGAITYSTNAKISISLGDKGGDVINLINNIEYQGGAMDTDVALDVMRSQFGTYARPNVRRVCVLITNQYSFKPDQTIEQARLARQEGIELYVIGIADRFGFEEEVLSMVENPQHILKIAKFDDLVSPMFNYGLSMEKLICSETAHDIPSNTGAHGAPKMNWSCDFESGNICDMIQDHDKDQFDWTVQTGPTPSDTTGPLAAHGGSYYAYIEASDPRKPDDRAILYLPKFNAEGSLCIRFAYNMYGSGIGTLELMKVTPSRAMTPLWLKTGEQGSDWFVKNVHVDLGLGDQLLFLAKRGHDHLGDIAIDDIKITGGACQ